MVYVHLVLSVSEPTDPRLDEVEPCRWVGLSANKHAFGNTIKKLSELGVRSPELQAVYLLTHIDAEDL